MIGNPPVGEMLMIVKPGVGAVGVDNFKRPIETVSEASSALALSTLDADFWSDLSVETIDGCDESIADSVAVGMPEIQTARALASPITITGTTPAAVRMIDDFNDIVFSPFQKSYGIDRSVTPLMQQAPESVRNIACGIAMVKQKSEEARFICYRYRFQRPVASTSSLAARF